MKQFLKKQLVALTLIVEGALIFIFLAWALWNDRPVNFVPHLDDLLIGAFLATPLLLVNFLIFGPLTSRFRFFHSCEEFKQTIVKPIAMQMDVFSALLVSLAAGLGEECFFRGLIQSELGLIAASVLFALMHFGTAINRYRLIFCLYLVFGFYFGFVFMYFQSLWIPVAMHVIYDFCALLFLRYVDKSSLESLKITADANDSEKAAENGPQ